MNKNCMLEKAVGSFEKSSLNILGEELTACCNNPITGFFRSGSCQTDKRDLGNHSVCAIINNEFLEFTKAQGNDLSTPNPRYGFPGLKQGDKWCLCASRWQEAKLAGILLDVDLSATHIRAYEVVNDFDFKWKFRVLKCSFEIFESQIRELETNKKLKKDLKLVVVPDKYINGCSLIGLDGTVKNSSNDFFKLNKLEEIINAMSIRKAELKDAR